MQETVPSRSSTHVCSEVIKWPPKEETLYCFSCCVTDRAALQCAQHSPEWFFNPTASTKVKKKTKNPTVKTIAEKKRPGGK